MCERSDYTFPDCEDFIDTHPSSDENYEDDDAKGEWDE